MDRMIYVAMTGAKQVMEQQSNTAHNLANLGTTGFRAQLDSFRAVPVEGQGLPTRAFVLDATAGSDFSQGVVQQTGNPLDVAIKGGGWIALQANDGTEVYSRAGNLGSLQSNAVEDSNVALTAELVNMITAQRNYQANAQTIKTQDQVMQTLVNLR